MTPEEWAAALEEWRIPQPILDAAEDSPWVLPEEVFSRRAELAITEPAGASYRRAVEALGDAGTVLDVGAGGGAASLPLASRITELTAVDGSRSMLDDLAARAAALGLKPRLIEGMWPEVAERAGPPGFADVVLAHHVVYNVADLVPFISALDAAAGRQVVVELTERHPLTALNPYWQALHGIDRPEGPTADDGVTVIEAALGHPVRVERWQRRATAEYTEFDTLVDVTRRRLCLPASRADEVRAVLLAEGHSPDSPPDIGSSGDSVVTVTWAPSPSSQ